jgi:hypothetical protein
VNTLDEQLERITTPPDVGAGQPEDDEEEDQPSFEEKS